MKFSFFNNRQTVNIPRVFVSLFLSFLTYQSVFASTAEHQAVLDLVPLSSVDRQVVQSGPWSDNKTWGGQLPSAKENIYVPEGVTLLVDIYSDVAIGTLRVDGKITFATNKNIKIKLDTLVVTSTGSFQIGDESNPVKNIHSVEIEIANNGSINRSWDTTNISRGIILQGKTRIYGVEKSAFHALSVDPIAGATQIQLERPPTNWAVNDIIAITATRFTKVRPGDTEYHTQDELRRIKSISGSTITLGSMSDNNSQAPLTFSHVPDIRTMPIYVANFTRNVIFKGEGENTVPKSQRGHFMVMHQPDTVIKGAGFYYLGRTDKSKPIDDFKLNKKGSRVLVNGNWVPLENNNPRGRYAVHFHHTGVNDISIPPVICSGNAVFNSPGWGFVNHTSNVAMENNASYDVYGAHFVSEDGNELGNFTNNIAIKAQGRGVVAKIGTDNHDVGHSGHGFWLESRNMIMDGNVVSGVHDSGIFYFHRNYITPEADLQIPVGNLLTNHKELVKNLPTIHYASVPLTHEKNDIILSSGQALTVVKENSDQRHDIRNIIESLKAYAVLNGIDIQYTEKYTFKDVDIVADLATREWNYGFSMIRKIKDVAIVNTVVDGFVHPFETGLKFFPGTQLPNETDVVFANVTVDDRALDLSTDIHKPKNPVIKNYNPIYQRISTINEAKGLGLILPTNQNVVLSRFKQGVRSRGVVISGVKSDSVGNIPFNSIWRIESLYSLLEKGYYLDIRGNRYIILKDVFSDRVSGTTNSIETKFYIKDKSFDKISAPQLN